MKRYIGRRTLLGVIVLLGVIIITFAMTRAMPVDPALLYVGTRATEEQIDMVRAKLGLDQPMHVQFVAYLTNVFKGDLGVSFITKRPVITELAEKIPATMELVLFGMVFAVIVGIFLGISSAKYKNRLADHFVRILSIGAVSLPAFWLALALQLIFYGELDVLPLQGRVSTHTALLYQLPNITGFLLFDSLITGNFAIFKDALRHIILPSIPIAMYPIGMVARLTRSSLLEIMNEDYITAARSYGIKERFVLWVYALKNSMGTTVTVVAVIIGYALVNTFLVESIFSWPGIGRYAASSIMSLDYPSIIGITLFSAATYLVLNLVADLIIALDPRIRI